ncbi:hypothetical protein [Psychrobacter ciconiae]|uniref:hypothetical protein n=1 Tax=Psychrobacter ciconiae TaxID=1553449 RepID=UPI00191B6EBE|nr:hypothetical protein [Psychrobacter ciconiae]
MSQPLRPIDAIFVHLEGRFYVIYHRGTLWQLPRMTLDTNAWARKKPYLGDKSALFLSRQQAVLDNNLAKQLRTLALPAAIQGATLPRFEAWWEAHGFFWLKDNLQNGTAVLASQPPKPDNQDIQATFEMSNKSQDPDKPAAIKSEAPTQSIKADDSIFAEMLADLTDEVLQQRH